MSSNPLFRLDFYFSICCACLSFSILWIRHRVASYILCLLIQFKYVIISVCSSYVSLTTSLLRGGNIKDTKWNDLHWHGTTTEDNVYRLNTVVSSLMSGDHTHVTRQQNSQEINLFSRNCNRRANPVRSDVNFASGYPFSLFFLTPLPYHLFVHAQICISAGRGGGAVPTL